MSPSLPPCDSPSAVLILNWNGWDQTSKTIEVLCQQEASFDIVVVDNGSAREEREAIRQAAVCFRTVFLDDNYGWAGGYNRGIQAAIKAGYTHLYLLNNDAIPETGFFTSSLPHITEGTAAVGSMVADSDGNHVYFDGEYHPGLIQRRHCTHELRAVKSVNGAGMLISSNAFQTVGPFDERFFCYHEERDWCERAATIAGLRIVVNPESWVRHAFEGSDVSNNALYYRFRNDFIPTSVRKPWVPIVSKRLHQRALEFLANNEFEKYDAALSGIEDGIAERFGKRQTLQPSFRTRVDSWLHRNSIGSALLNFELALQRKLTRRSLTDFDHTMKEATH